MTSYLARTVLVLMPKKMF